MKINPEFRPDPCEDFRAVESPPIPENLSPAQKEFCAVIAPHLGFASAEEYEAHLRALADAKSVFEYILAPMAQQEAIAKALCAGLDAVHAAMTKKPIK